MNKDINYWNSFCDKWTRRLIIAMKAFKNIDTFDWETDNEVKLVLFYINKDAHLAQLPIELFVGNYTLDELDNFEYSIKDIEENIANYYQEQERVENLARIKSEALAKLTTEEIEVLESYFVDTIKHKKRNKL